MLISSPLGSLALSALGAVAVKHEDQAIYDAVRYGLEITAVTFCGFSYLVYMVMLSSQSCFGVDSMLWSHNLQTSAEHTPEGHSRVAHVTLGDPDSTTDREEPVPGVLRHSRVYDNPEVHRVIADWLRSRSARPT